ncbi:sporulation protein [Pseudomethylobacillus aquaticus]|uniref:Sporulation protein n=1 Tax=Pseudomethylobacillus aquaticus TaxID=2676064 RepID=A0A3N0V5R4_9PROT|nr:SPOR domain-containing protein [Pseudomethylobacillus aquaticus]ROH88053.1 sporulation protein [Pseudomethylobacillus aquaticus]
MASKQLNEQEIQFQKRARRRLVGAVALVLVMVTVLPMILDDHAEPLPQQAIDISIPSQQGTEHRLPVEEEAVELPLADSAEPESLPADDLPELAPAPAAPQAPAKSETRSQESKAVEAKPAASKPAAPNSVEAKPKPAAVSTASSFAVQIGVFSEADNVKQLQAKLSLLGVESYTETVETSAGQKIRLRAGPYPDRAAADNVLVRLKSADIPGMVVSNK